MTQRLLGAIPSKYDSRDYKLSKFMAVAKSFPIQFIIENLPDVYDQGNYSQCVAFSTAELQESNQLKETGIRTKLSTNWIYGNRVNTDYCGEGMEPKNALSHLCNDGVVPYDLMPGLKNFSGCYADMLINKENLLPQATPNKSLSYIKLTTNDEIRTNLMNCGATLMCIAVYSSFDNTGSNGIVPDAYIMSDYIRGYHAMLCVGWKRINDNPYWIVQNSWGKEWGKDGYCYIPFNWLGLTNGGECWGVTDFVPEYHEIKMDVPAQIINNRTFVPIRFIAESLGGTVEWDQEKQMVTINIDDKKITMVIGEKVIKVY